MLLAYLHFGMARHGVLALSVDVEAAPSCAAALHGAEADGRVAHQSEAGACWQFVEGDVGLGVVAFVVRAELCLDARAYAAVEWYACAVGIDEGGHLGRECPRLHKLHEALTVALLPCVSVGFNFISRFLAAAM